MEGRKEGRKRGRKEERGVRMQWNNTAMAGRRITLHKPAVIT